MVKSSVPMAREKVSGVDFVLPLLLLLVRLIHCLHSPPLLQTGDRRNARRLGTQDFACACVFCLNAKTFREIGRQSRRGLAEPFVGFSASFRGKCGDSAVGGDVA